MRLCGSECFGARQSKRFDIAVAICAALASLGVYMVINPTLNGAASSEASKARARGIMSILEFIWGWPAGVVLVLVGLLVIAGKFLRTKPALAQQANSPAM